MTRKGAVKIGAAVTRLREAKGWTQQRLAEAAGLSQPYVANVEAGRYGASLAVAQSLAKALGVTVDELLQ
jgi:transcriptional regulator with XRE-family HTH domain